MTKVIDINDKLIVKKIMQGDSFIFCAECENEEAGFAIMGAFNQQGKYYIKSLICLSEQCNGETELHIENGIVIV